MTTARRTQQQRRDQTETALLNAAAELAVEHGVRSLTLARVGERAGYSRGIVTHHFGSKQALLERLARATQTGFVPGLAGLPPGLDRLLRLVDGYVSALAELGVLNRAFLLLWAEAATASELAPIFRERDDAFRADLRDDVRAGIADGTIRPDAAPGEVAVEIVGQLRGIGLQRLLDPPAVNIERLHHTVTEHWRRAERSPVLTPGHCAKRTDSTGNRPHGAGNRHSYQVARLGVPRACCTFTTPSPTCRSTHTYTNRQDPQFGSVGRLPRFKPREGSLGQVPEAM
jgi:AcrR family transcriptional regulator